jgi:hypothetical protein
VIVSENQDSAQGNEKQVTKTSRHIIGWTGVVFAVAIVLGILVQLLWNWLMPEIFGLGRITILQGIGLLVLARLLFGRMGQRRDHSGYLTGKYGFRSLSWLGRGAKEDSANS